MNLNQLQYFFVLSEQEHMSASAVSLGISQSALSKSISSLEKEVGTKLFDRSGNAIRLNDYGKTFAIYAKKALDDIQLGLQSIKQSRYNVSGEVRIHCHAFPDILMDCIMAYTEWNPKVRFSISKTWDNDSERIAQADFLLGTQAEPFMLNTDNVLWTPFQLLEEEAYIFISPRYRSYPKSVTSLDIAELKEDFFIVMEETSLSFSDFTYKLCYASGYSPKIFCATEDFLTKMSFIDAGKAICILPGCCLRTARRLSPDIQAFKIKNFDTRRNIFLLHHQKSIMSEAALDFWNFVQDFYNHWEEE